MTDIAAELPLVVIAELLGVPNEDRHRMFDWSNRMIGSDDPEYQTAGEVAQMASMELYAYASELFGQKRVDPHDDLMSVLTQVEIEGEQLSSLELELFFLLLTVAGNETTRNLISGAMATFFDHPDQWEMLRKDRSLLPDAVEEMLRYVTPVMNFRRQTTAGVRARRARRSRPTPRWCSSTSRPTATRRCSPTPRRSTSPATPTRTWPSVPADPTSAWAPTWPAWRSG